MVVLSSYCSKSKYMTQEKNPKPVESTSVQRLPTGHNTHILGHISIDGIAPVQEPGLDIKINAIGPAAYEPARAVPYLGTAQKEA